MLATFDIGVISRNLPYLSEGRNATHPFTDRPLGRRRSRARHPARTGAALTFHAVTVVGAIYVNFFRSDAPDPRHLLVLFPGADHRWTARGRFSLGVDRLRFVRSGLLLRNNALGHP